MLTRRQLLARGTTLLVLVPVVPAVLQGCSSSSPNEQQGPSCAGTADLSTVDDGHTHSVCVLTSDMTSPPATGVTYTSSNEGNHTHTITLTQAQLAAVASGQSVTVTSSSDVDPATNMAHTHKWTITKATTGTTTPPPSGW